MLNKLLFLGLLLAASSSSFAQKMSVLDYFKAFATNVSSPNNQLASAKQELSIQPSSNPSEYVIKYYANQSRTSLITVDAKNSFLTYKQGFHEGWNGGHCYPTFKVYTKADGTQILGVTEDSYTHNSYKSKYRPKQADLGKRLEEGNEICPQYQWNKKPKPIKFWTYKAGTWTEVTDEVMTEFFTLEQMIAKTSVNPEEGLSMGEHLTEHISYLIYPLYRIEPDKNEITVWVDEARLRLFTTEVEEFASASDNLTSRKNSMPEYWDFLIGTSFKSYTLVWNEQKGQFVRK